MNHHFCHLVTSCSTYSSFLALYDYTTSISPWVLLATISFHVIILYPTTVYWVSPYFPHSNFHKKGLICNQCKEFLYGRNLQSCYFLTTEKSRCLPWVQGDISSESECGRVIRFKLWWTIVQKSLSEECFRFESCLRREHL